MTTTAEHRPHVEVVQHHTTSMTMVSEEFEVDVRVAAKELAADGVVTLELHEAGGQPLPRWQPGAHVDLILPDAPTRQYSLCGDPADHHCYRLGILREPASRGGSEYIHDRLQVGDIVRVRGPRNNFPLAHAPRYLFIAGGIGITPLLTMIAQAERVGADWRLVYGGRRRESMAFLDELARYGDRVSVRPQDETGLLDLGVVTRWPARRHTDLLLRPGTVAGRGRRAQPCLAGQVPARRAFRTQARRRRRGSTEAFEITLASSGLTLTVPGDRSILSVVEEAGISVLSSCGEGTCGSCEVPVLDGKPDHRDSVLDEDERQANGCMMICVSRACSARLTLDL